MKSSKITAFAKCTAVAIPANLHPLLVELVADPIDAGLARHMPGLRALYLAVSKPVLTASKAVITVPTDLRSLLVDLVNEPVASGAAEFVPEMPDLLKALRAA